MLDKVGKYEFLAEPFHCDFSKRLFMGHLGNHMLNAADFHAAHRGFGMTYLNPLHKTWVLSRLAIEMEEMPLQYTKFYVETWVDGVMKFFTNRNFRVVDAEDSDKVYGYGRSIWALIDTDSRQPQNIMDVNEGEIMNYVETGRDCPIDALSRVRMSKDAKLVASMPTHYSDVDVNGHINSVKYIEHVLDLFDLNIYRECRIKRFDIAYVAESYYGDVLKFYMETVSENVFCVRITRTSKDASDEVDVCRSKIEFVKD